jgi:hypothetical protein
MQSVVGTLSQAVKWLGMDLTTHLHPVVRLRMRGDVPPLHHNISKDKTIESYKCVSINGMIEVIRTAGPRRSPTSN